MRAIDKYNLDEQYGATAKELSWPENLSENAKKALGYFDDTAYLFTYLGRYIITDESGWLTDYGTGKMDDPWGCPRAEFDSLDEIGPWLEDTWEEVKDDQ